MTSVKATKSELVQYNTELAEAFEHTQSELALVQRQLDDILYLNLNDLPDREEYAVLPTAKKRQIIRRLRILRHENPLAKQAMKLAQRFTFGKGVSYVIKNKESRKVISEFWENPENAAVLTSHSSMRDRFDEVLTDGEKFLVMFASDVPPYVKLGEIPMEEIVDIIYSPDNRFVPVYYKRKYFKMEYDANAQNGEGEWKKVGKDGQNTKPFITYYRDYRITDEQLDEMEGLSIPDSMVEEDAFVRHRMVNPLWTKQGRRGISELFASREWFRVFKEFMEDRGAINAAANTFSYVRKVKGGASAVAAIKGKIGSQTVGLDESNTVKRMTRPVAGAFYDINEAMDVSALRADTGAADAKEDARMLLMTGGAGVGTMLPYFGEGGDANLATAQAMELPMVKMFEDYQQEVQDDLDAISVFVLEKHYGETRAEASANQPIDDETDPENPDSQRVDKKSEDPSNSKNGSKPPVAAAEALVPPPAVPSAPAAAPPGAGNTINVQMDTRTPEEKEADKNEKALAGVDVEEMVDDRFTISWQFPPIVTQDVVKYTTAWAQLVSQVAPGNKVVKSAAIRGALTTMNVPNVEEMMERIQAEEDFLAAEKAKKKAEMEARFAQSGMMPGGPPQPGTPPQPSGAPDPLGPDLKRIANGKPPRQPATGGRLSNRQGLTG
jgi:hypothetical protein